jgi:hypothetical protein
MTEQKLGGFEERLLGELRREVVASGGSPEVVVTKRQSRVRRRVTFAAALGFVAVAVAVGGVFLTRGAAPAYAVTKNANGTVTVQIDSLSDAAGLEQKLKEAGVPAVVEYLPEGKMCAHPWFTPWRHHPGGMTSSGVDQNSGMTMFTIDGPSLPDDVTLVITTQTLGPAPDGSGHVGSALGIAYAQGPVPACQVVDAPPGPPLTNG